MGEGGRCAVCSGTGEYEAEYRWPNGRVHRQVEPCGDCDAHLLRDLFAIVAGEGVPRGEVWCCEPLTPLQRAAGFRPRVLGTIVGLGE